MPQLSVPPQPSGSEPHSSLQNFLGLQPQLLVEPPPPQVSGAVQVPQLTLFPQPSVTFPQFLLAQGLPALQPQTFEVPPPPQV